MTSSQERYGIVSSYTSDRQAENKPIVVESETNANTGDTENETDASLTEEELQITDNTTTTANKEIEVADNISNAANAESAASNVAESAVNEVAEAPIDVGSTVKPPAETVGVTGESSANQKESGVGKPEISEENEEDKMKLIIGDTVLTADLADNSSAAALIEILKQGDITIDMRDYGNMEKVGGIGQNLPTNDESITTESGDLILYQGSALVIYYAPNSWSFTRLGKIRNVTSTELKQILGDGNVTVTLSIE